MRHAACLHERRPVRIVDDADGAAELHKAYTEFGLTERAFHDDFTRLAVLKELQAGGAIDASMRRR